MMINSYLKMTRVYTLRNKTYSEVRDVDFLSVVASVMTIDKSQQLANVLRWCVFLRDKPLC